MRGFARIEGEGVTAAFAEAVKDFCAALVCQFGVIRGVEGRAEVDGGIAIAQGGQWRYGYRRFLRGLPLRRGRRCFGRCG